MSLKSEIKSFGFAVKGAITSLQEKHVRFHLTAFFVVVLVNFLLDVSALEWAITLTCATLVVVTEVLNTVAEEIMDFIHPEQHEKVGKVKDLAAGAVLFAAMGSLVVAGIIYLPKVIDLI